MEIIRANAPEVSEPLARAVTLAVQRLRGLGLAKSPGPAEAIDWARAVTTLGQDELSTETALATLGWVVKVREDVQLASQRIADVLGD